MHSAIVGFSLSLAAASCEYYRKAIGHRGNLHDVSIRAASPSVNVLEIGRCFFEVMQTDDALVFPYRGMLAATSSSKST